MIKKSISGFTLIEMSIVLVIIGLIVGGVLVGQDLIQAARTRATISQIEHYNTAANTFYGKYGSLPGDINQSAIAQFGNFTVPRCPDAANTNCYGEGNGDGLLESWSDWFLANTTCESSGETVVFWVDLTQAGLLDQSFVTATESGVGNGTNSYPDTLLPHTPINSTYLYAYSNNGINYYGLSAVSWNGGPGAGAPSSALGLTVTQAYNIDRKIDDAFPQSGNVIAQYVNYGNSGGSGTNNAPKWAMGGLAYQAGSGPYGINVGADPGTPASASSLTCYDNGGNASSAMQYSIGVSRGTGLNCALSFKFQ